MHRSGYLVPITVVLGLLSGAGDSVCQQRQSERPVLPTLTKAHDAHSPTSDVSFRQGCVTRFSRPCYVQSAAEVG